MRLVGIATKNASRAPMRELQEAAVSTEAGLAGDFRGEGGLDRLRQVTVLSADLWRDACRELGTQLPWHTRRANLCVEGLAECGPQDVGRTLSIGDVVLEITGETAPCSRMDEARPGLRAALTAHWRAGYTCRVREGGRLRLGDAVRLD